MKLIVTDDVLAIIDSKLKDPEIAAQYAYPKYVLQDVRDEVVALNGSQQARENVIDILIEACEKVSPDDTKPASYQAMFQVFTDGVKQRLLELKGERFGI